MFRSVIQLYRASFHPRAANLPIRKAREISPSTHTLLKHPTSLTIGMPANSRFVH